MNGKGGWKQSLKETLFRGCLLLLAVLGGWAPVGLSAAELTTVMADDPQEDPVGLARFTVADAQNGRPIASGTSLDGTFTFSSPPNREVMVFVLTKAGYVGQGFTEGGVPLTIDCEQPAGNIQLALVGSDVLSLQVNDAAGAPVAGARVSVVLWSSFEPITRGATATDGRFEFTPPSDVANQDFLAIVWKNGQIIGAQVFDQGAVTEGGGTEGGFPGF